MKNFIFNKAFLLGFTVAVASFVIINLMTLLKDTETRIYHKMNGIGFPFAFYEWGGHPYIEGFSQFGIIANITIFLIYSLLIGAFFSYLWQVQVRRNGGQ